MKEKTRRILRLVLLAVFLVSTVLLVRRQQDKVSGSETYEQAQQIAAGGSAEATEGTVPAEETLPEARTEMIWIPEPVEDGDPNLETMAAIDLAALRQTNQDVIGWIWIPNSKVNYPLMQGEDNDYYLKHTWEGRNNAVGSIFLEYQNSPDLTDFNTIVYGHNMNDGSMFAGIRNYSTEGYWMTHPYIYLTTDAGVYRYEVFSSYKADVDGETYGLSFELVKTKARFLLHALENSVIDTGIMPDVTDRILTLSTCSGAGYTTRWVVHARLKMVEVEVQASAE